MTPAREEETVASLIKSGCLFKDKTIIPPKVAYSNWNNNKDNWTATNILLQEFGYTFERDPL